MHSIILRLTQCRVLQVTIPLNPFLEINMTHVHNRLIFKHAASSIATTDTFYISTTTIPRLETRVIHPFDVSTLTVPLDVLNVLIGNGISNFVSCLTLRTIREFFLANLRTMAPLDATTVPTVVSRRRC
jgi:hypothetical protein